MSDSSEVFEWEAMVSDRTSQKRRQRYFMEFRERIQWYWQMKAGMRDDDRDGDFRVDEELS